VRAEEIRALCGTYRDRVAMESRWVVRDSETGEASCGGFNLDKSVVSKASCGGFSLGSSEASVLAGYDWMVVRFVFPWALRPWSPAPPNGRRVSAAAGSLADWSMDAVPGLEEFRSMLCGARVVVRLPASGLSRQDSVEAARLVEAIEGYLCSVGCSVDRLPAFALTNGLVGGAVAATAGCETSMQMLSRRPPAYIIINGDMDALRAEFQAGGIKSNGCGGRDAAATYRYH
ncbi:hypothetical protein GGF37_004464, partial [Kickxella alabastrina]